MAIGRTMRTHGQRGVGAIVACLSLAALFGASPAGAGQATPEERSATALVSIQVSEGGDSGAARAMMSELAARGIPATLWVSRTVRPAEESAYLSGLTDAGYEIAAECDVDLGSLGHDEQLRLVGEIAAAVREAAGRRPSGLRIAGPARNEGTLEVAIRLGFYYIMGDVDGDPRFGDVPYFPEDGPLAILGVTTARYPDGSVGALGDLQASASMSASEFQDLLFSAIDQRLAVGRPMVFDWHPAATSRPRDASQWWQAFLGVLAYLESKGSAVRFVTARDLVFHYDMCGC